MTEYQYKATILKTDRRHKVMEVLYTSPGRKDILCGVALPATAEEVGQTIHDAVPFGVWYEDERTVYVPQIGTFVEGTVKLGGLALENEIPSPSLPYSHPPASSNQALAEQEQARLPVGGSGFPTRYTPDNSLEVGRAADTGSHFPEVVL
jgi:hypothetical protein